jgi:hypothetical protein
MATYYVRLDGNDSNTGLGSTPALAWQTLDKALGATGITSGDTLWIAPGDYRRASTLTVNGTYTSMVFIKGNPSASQFPGISAARILISSRLGSDTGTGVSVLNPIIDLNSKNFMTWEDIVFEQAYLQRPLFHARTSTNLTFRRCIFLATGQQQIDFFAVTYAPSVTRNILFTQCAAFGLGYQSFWSDSQTVTPAANYTYNMTIDRCWNVGCVMSNASNHTFGAQGIYFVNSYAGWSTQNLRGNAVIRNCVFWQGNPYAQGSTGTGIIEYSSFLSPNGWNYAYGAGNVDDAFVFPAQEGIIERLYQLGSSYPYPLYNSNLLFKNGGTSAGTTIPTLAGLPGYSATGTPLTDFYGNPWDGNGTPHIGLFNNYSTTITNVPYVPSENIESMITVPEGATSQTIYISLGWTGLTHTTTGLNLSYTRDRSTRVAITPVAQTVTGAWVSGGFCEVDAVNQPGLYRLDVPNAAFVSGTTGVVVTGKGVGYALSITHIRFSAPAPLMVRMGAFKVTRMRGNRVEDDIIDVVQGSEHDIELALEDAEGVSVPLTGASTSVSIADSSGVVTSATTTILYGDGGRLSFRLSTAYTNEPGTYKVYVNRTDDDGTQVFGPLRMVVRSL